MIKTFTDEEVLQIRYEAQSAKVSINDLAMKYKAPYYTMYQLVKGTTYKSCDGPIVSRRRTRQGEFIPDPVKRERYRKELKEKIEKEKKAKLREKQKLRREEIEKIKQEKKKKITVKDVSKGLRKKIKLYSKKGATIGQLSKATKLDEKIIKVILKKG